MPVVITPCKVLFDNMSAVGIKIADADSVSPPQIECTDAVSETEEYVFVREGPTLREDFETFQFFPYGAKKGDKIVVSKGKLVACGVAVVGSAAYRSCISKDFLSAMFGDKTVSDEGFKRLLKKGYIKKA